MAEQLKISRRYAYDAENQLTSVTCENGIVISYSYDKAGNRIAVSRTAAVQPDAGTAAAESGLPEHLSSAAPEFAVQCKNCGKPVRPGKKFCSNCGFPLTLPASSAANQGPSPSVCPGCGTPVRSGAKFCGKCGRKLN